MTYSFDVYYATHEDLKAKVAPRRHRVDVLADNYHDALATATGMVASVTDAMPVEALIRL